MAVAFLKCKYLCCSSRSKSASAKAFNHQRQSRHESGSVLHQFGHRVFAVLPAIDVVLLQGCPVLAGVCVRGAGHGGADQGLGEVELARVDIAPVQVQLEVHVVGAARVVARKDAAELGAAFAVGDLHAAQVAARCVGADARIGALGIAVPDLQGGAIQGAAVVQSQHFELQPEGKAGLAIGDVLAQQGVVQVEGTGGLLRGKPAGAGRLGSAQARPVQDHQAAEAELQQLSTGGEHGPFLPVVRFILRLAMGGGCAHRSRSMRMLPLIFRGGRVYRVRRASRPGRGRHY